MDTTNLVEVKNMCKAAAEYLIEMYKKNPSKRLVFPFYRENGIRVSEQEARFAFSNILQNSSYFYSVETPTVHRYSDFSTDRPKIHFCPRPDTLGRSASIDLSIFTKKNLEKPFVNIEFKSGQPGKNSIMKDVLKLSFEAHDVGVFFHVLSRGNKNSFNTLIQKIKASIEETRTKGIQPIKDIIFFIVRVDTSQYMQFLLDSPSAPNLELNNFELFNYTCSV